MGHALDAVVALCGLRQDDPRAPRWRSRASTCPAVALYGGSIEPGRVAGKDVTIQDVFEAVGAHAAGNDLGREALRRRGGRVSRRGRVRRPVHGEHDGDGAHVPRPLADGRERRPGDGPREGRRRARRGPPRHGAPRGRPDAVEDPHARRPSRTRSRPSPRPAARRTRSCTSSRSRARPACRSSSTTSTRSRRGRRSSSTSSRAAASRRPTSRAPAARACRAGGSSEAGLVKNATTVTGRSLFEEAAGRRRDAGAGSRPRRRAGRSSRTAGSRSCAARSRPRAAS